MAGSRLTITRRPAIAVAPRASVEVTTTGSISGVRPTATASAKSTACGQRPVASPLTIATSGTSTAMKRSSIQLTEATPRSNAVAGRGAAISRPIPAR